MEAGAALATDPERARELMARCRALQPGEPTHVLGEANALRRLSQDEASRELLDQELVRLEEEPSAWAEAALARADLAQEEGDLVSAHRLWARILERKISPAMDRTANVRMEGAPIDAVRRYFQPGDDDVKLFLLREASQAEPRSRSVRYLLGRRLQLAGESAAALPVLEQLLSEDLPPAIGKETARLAIEAAFAIGRCDRVKKWATTGAWGPAFEARAADWVERCAFAFPEGKP